MGGAADRRGIALAIFGALVLTPDALLMRLSGMDGFQMLAWRGICMGLIFVGVWAVTSSGRGRDLALMASPAALLIIPSQIANAGLFPLGIAAAPVSVVLLGVATVPIWAAVLARVFYGETAGPATWITIACVLAGLGFAVSEPGAAQESGALFGAFCGLSVALALAVNFVILQHNPEVPLLLAIGIGALCAGAIGWAMSGTARLDDGALWAIAPTALLILPLSFFALSQASRHTSAANVSLLLLLETVLGPAWVWIGIGEAPGWRMLVGGAVVIGALAAYILHSGRAQKQRSEGLA
jgi:drug/metabolite transporter (DMT)-like permease